MTWFALAAVCLLTSLGQVAQKLAVRRWTPQHGPLARLRSPWLWVALASMAAALLLWLWVLRLVDVGWAYPMLSLNFVLVAIAARWLFGETADARHWLGIGLIAAGVAVLGAAS